MENGQEKPETPRTRISRESSASDVEALCKRTCNVLLSRLATMVMLTLFVAAATGLTFFFTRRSSMETIDILGRALRRDLLARTADQLRTLLSTQSHCSDQLSNAIWRAWDFNETLVGPAPQPVINEVADYFVQYADIVNAVGFATPEGITADVFDQVQGAPAAQDLSTYSMIFTNQSAPPEINPPVYVRVCDRMTRGTIAGPVFYSDQLSGRSSYYDMGRDSPTGKAIAIAPGLANLEPNLIQVQQIGFDQGGSFRGIAGCTTSLRAVGEFLTRLQLEGGIIYVTSGPSLLASSVGYTGHNSTGNGNDLLHPSESSNPLLRASAAFLEEHAAALAAAGASARGADADVTLLGVRYFLTKTDMVFEDFRMSLVMVSPRKAIMKKIDEKTRITIVIITVSAAGIGIVGCFLVVLLTSPISEEIKLKRELIRQLEAKKQAEERNETKSRFLANMSHELRSPLASILGLLDLMLDDHLSPTQHNSALQMRECANGLLGLLNDILDFSKIEAGKVSLEAMDFDAIGLMENLIEIMSVQSGRKGIELVLDVAEGIGPVLYGDPSRFRQIFTNLLNNSIKFTKEGFVTLRCREAEEKKGWLVFDVEDSGCGIPRERAAQVFEAFVQADPSTTRLYGGTGLGLTIVKSLVDLMGGTITIADKASPGTIFRVRLRLQISSRRNTDSGRAFKIPPAATTPVPPVLTRLPFTPTRFSSGNPALTIELPPSFPWITETRSSSGNPSPGKADSPSPQWLQRLKSLRKAGSDSARIARASKAPRDATVQGPTPRSRYARQNRRCTDSTLLRAASCLKSDSPIKPKPFEGARVLLMMTGRVGRAVAVRFLENQGLVVSCAADWAAARQALAANARAPARLAPLETRFASAASVARAECEPLAENPNSAREAAAGSAYEVVFLDVFLLDASNPDAFERTLGKVRELFDGYSGESDSQRKGLDENLEPGVSGRGAQGARPNAAAARQRPPRVVWLVGNEASPHVRQRLHKESFGRVLQKPVFDSRLREVLTGLAASWHDEPAPDSPGTFALSSSFPGSGPGTALSDVKEGLGESQPTTPVAQTRNPVRQSPSVQRAVERIKEAKYRVLVAEDTPVLRQLAQALLKKVNVRGVVTVENGQQALDAVIASNLSDVKDAEGRQPDPFDFVLMDCQMPVMDGYAATRAIRAAESARARTGKGARQRPRLLILALTAHAMAEDEAKCLQSGMDIYLTKPLQIGKLAEVIVEYKAKEQKLLATSPKSNQLATSPKANQIATSPK